MMSIRFKKISESDYPFLRKALYDAVYVPEGEKPYPKSIINLPEISKYIDNWSDDKDFGLIIQIGDKQIGAVWGRLLSEEKKGFGYIDDSIPEISMSVNHKYRG